MGKALDTLTDKFIEVAGPVVGGVVVVADVVYVGASYVFTKVAEAFGVEGKKDEKPLLSMRVMSIDNE